MRKFEFSSKSYTAHKLLARRLIDYEFDFEVDFSKKTVRVILDDSSSVINQFYTFMVDHYDREITLSDILDSEVLDKKQ
ncbi:hypothetical protein PP935_gp067 [Rhizobium phage RHph_N34]|uniref:Uncharacterized protein n=1 Tax=Rhizobium phage RHph_N34 TaxID=2509586 RepID=A0A7S5R9Z2_9CAUD|nr:hypothetical protein PP935_gp067 [Rhizobium phage RHph_N34]QIG73842.1 hypothetical protein EVC06_067 [Rhizobium phage RHph_N34]